MKKTLIFTSLLTLACTLNAKSINFDFEQTKSGNLPKNWQNKMTNSDKSSAIWEVEEKNGNKILTLKEFKDKESATFNLCYTKEVQFKDGEISVKFKANSGKSDQGGGIMWRVQDKNNYYVARYNPLEDNFRFYIVKNGSRKELCSANVHLSDGWHTMKIKQNGDKFIGYLDNKKLLECKDSTIKKSGGVGVWTKSDAATSFDEFKILW